MTFLVVLVLCKITSKLVLAFEITQILSKVKDNGVVTSISGIRGEKQHYLVRCKLNLPAKS